MKDYFPFTDYDFYAYLASGGALLSVLDFVLNDAGFLSKDAWTVIQVVIAVFSAYITGHIVALLAQATLENLVMAKCLPKPMTLQLGFALPSVLSKLVGFFVGRYYGPLPGSTQARILNSAATELKKTAAEFNEAEEIFLVGFRKSFESESARQRIDDFRNQYGFCRNISFVAFVAFLLVISRALNTKNIVDFELAIAAAVASFAMFVRFVKFLSSFQAEVIQQLK